MPLTPEASEALDRILSGQRQILDGQKRIEDKLDCLVDALAAGDEDEDRPSPDLDGGDSGGTLPAGQPL